MTTTDGWRPLPGHRALRADAFPDQHGPNDDLVWKTNGAGVWRTTGKYGHSATIIKSGDEGRYAYQVKSGTTGHPTAYGMADSLEDAQLGAARQLQRLSADN